MNETSPPPSTRPSVTCTPVHGVTSKLDENREYGASAPVVRETPSTAKR